MTICIVALVEDIFFYLSLVAAKSHDMKALSPQEPYCPSQSWQFVGISSSARLICSKAW